MRNIILPPEDSEELAELIGLIFGDGCMNSYSTHTHLIEIAGNSFTDKDYHLSRVRDLFENLFNITPYYGKGSGEHAIRTIVRSRMIVDFLESKGVRKGRKNSLIVPLWIKSNDCFFKAFIR